MRKLIYTLCVLVSISFAVTGCTEEEVHPNANIDGGGSDDETDPF